MTGDTKLAVLKDHFALLRTRIEPQSDRVKKAQEMPGKVREYLEKHEGFETESPGTRLAGSYLRHTAITKLKDVDILVFAAQSWRDKPIKDMLKSLRDVLDGLPEELEDCGEVTTRTQRRSVNVVLEKHDLSLDIVPVFQGSGGTKDVLEVPDRQWDDFVFSHPLGYSSYLSQINGENGNKIVPLIKMFKCWRECHFPVKNRPKSYWLESMVVQHIRRGWLTTDGKGDAALVADLFESIYNQFKPIYDIAEETPHVPDGMLRNPVAFNWRRSAFETFMSRLDENRQRARKAVDTKDDEEAVELWKEVFGDEYFPSTADVEASKTAETKASQLNQSGPLFVSALGTVSSERPTGVKSVQAPSTRFFGES